MMPRLVLWGTRGGRDWLGSVIREHKLHLSGTGPASQLKGDPDFRQHHSVFQKNPAHLPVFCIPIHPGEGEIELLPHHPSPPTGEPINHRPGTPGMVKIQLASWPVEIPRMEKALQAPENLRVRPLHQNLDLR